MTEFASYEWLFYGGIAAVAFAGLLLFVQTVIFLTQKSSISKKMDEEYGQPQKYNRKGN